jgi:predicted site-specific integrase-resolvase
MEMIMTLDVGERLMSMTDLSEMLGVSIQTLYRWRHKGRARSAIGLGGM